MKSDTAIPEHLLPQTSAFDVFVAGEPMDTPMGDKVVFVFIQTTQGQVQEPNFMFSIGKYELYGVKLKNPRAKVDFESVDFDALTSLVGQALVARYPEVFEKVHGPDWRAVVDRHHKRLLAKPLRSG